MQVNQAINRNSRIAFHYQLSDIMQDMIESGKYLENDKLPSERELCVQYALSRSTVRQAISQLEREGYVRRIQGKGTFVSQKKYNQNLEKIYSFTEDMKQLGKNPTTVVLEFMETTCEEKIAKIFNVAVGTKIYNFKRLRLVNSEPIIIENNYVLADRFPDLKKKDLENNSMYQVFTNKFDLQLTYAEETFEPVLIRETESKLLNFECNLPGMKIERISYENDRIVEYTKSIVRGDKFRYHVKLGG